MENFESERAYGVRRVYETTRDGSKVSLRLKDRIVDLPAGSYDVYAKVAAWLPSNRSKADISKELGYDEKKVVNLLSSLEESGLIYKYDDIPEKISGEDFHADYFSKILPSWLDEAFSHPFWGRMMSGKGSARLFAGWLIELYHYTKNANRHMPLSCAHAHEKQIKLMRARHYAEEWNHYHYFVKSLKALGYTEKQITESVPLPMTLALSNFMRQAAREDVLAYSICSAVLEGTTTERKTFNPYYDRSAELYGIPREAIQPIYAHLDLDIQYQHSDLFHDILSTVPSMTRERAARVLDYGHQLVEHIWQWTENIERYYDDPANPFPRAAFDPFLD
jgi:pyrroloquinoline quinone (PQQ) biosynthesis protein C